MRHVCILKSKNIEQQQLWGIIPVNELELHCQLDVSPFQVP
jgi:hypothetical protein